MISEEILWIILAIIIILIVLVILFSNYTTIINGIIKADSTESLKTITIPRGSSTVTVDVVGSSRSSEGLSYSGRFVFLLKYTGSESDFANDPVINQQYIGESSPFQITLNVINSSKGKFRLLIRNLTEYNFKISAQIDVQNINY